MAGSLQLRDYPSEIMRLSCEKCGRAGQYRKQTLIERYGADIRLPVPASFHCDDLPSSIRAVSKKSRPEASGVKRGRDYLHRIPLAAIARALRDRR
jgi:hypothetical protein